MEKTNSILVVSSELTNCDALRNILGREGWTTTCACTVGECEPVLESQNIDLVICERHLSDGTYREVLTSARTRNPSIRLVVTSRLADWDQYLEVLRVGAFDLITFPGQTTDIIRVVNQAQREKQTGLTIVAGKAHRTSAVGLA